ncbi:MAG: rod shape-determining protein [Calditrichaeota bacterium]|nr:MAG: rod shape-determining protein [Calditrichota bacterium]MBL1207786.1 rod shape-determining protein [Calditrichota bacterium]NOG47620.1 rod shape-determining protein [Calditrichota bacterium]
MLKLFRKIFTNIGVDLGTANTIVYVAEKGFVVNEPSVIAYKSKGSVIAIGRDAKYMFGKTHKGITVIRPLADGVIADFVAGEELIKSFIRLAEIPRFFINDIVIGVPTGVTSVEKRAVIESAESAGARRVYLVSEPMAAAIGVGINVLGSNACMIVDIGGGTTDIAVINYGGIVVDNTIRIAGDEMNEAIIRYIKNTYNLRIGESTAERLKIEYGVVGDQPEIKFQIKGLDAQSGLPRQIDVDSTLFKDALKDVLNTMINSILTTLDKLPPELASDVIDRGIILTGGGALLKGLDTYLRDIVNLPVSRPGNALYCVAEGTRKILENFEMFKPVLFT